VRSPTPERFDPVAFVLSGFAVAGITFGFSVAGLTVVPWQAVVALIAGGALSLTLYQLRARRGGVPVLDFGLLRLPTFRASFIGGFVFRIGIGAMPFLLPLLLQVGFMLTPFQSGLITFSSTVGALSMKFAAAPTLKRFGFRPVLIVNAILGGASIAA